MSNKNIFEKHGCFAVDEFNFECEILHSKYHNVIEYNNKGNLLVPIRELDGDMSIENFKSFQDDLSDTKNKIVKTKTYHINENDLSTTEEIIFEEWGFKSIEIFELGKYINSGII
jgi:hypothetical protein